MRKSIKKYVEKKARELMEADWLDGWAGRYDVDDVMKRACKFITQIIGDAKGRKW